MSSSGHGHRVRIRSMRPLAALVLSALLLATLATPSSWAADPGPETTPAGTPPATPAAGASPAAGRTGLAWSRVRSERAPAAREDHTWTVDTEGRFAYLFGGRDGRRVHGDLWRFDLATDAWSRLSPEGAMPAARFGHNAAWLDGLGLVIFAGQRGADFFGDLWAYDPGHDRWRELPARGVPPRARYGSCMVVRPDGRLHISHGFTFAGRFDDTRAYGPQGGRWANVSSDGRRPGERCLHDCFTSASGELVLFGGQDDDDLALGDLWATRADRAWRRLPDPPLPARRLYAVTEAGDDAWIFGGVGRAGMFLDDLWRIDRDTLGFERTRVAGPSPSGRYGATLVHDAARGRLLLFGGRAREARADLWQLSGVPAGAGEAVGPAASMLPSPSLPPAASAAP
jgi:hypothetical protein